MRPLKIYEDVIRVTNNKELAHVIAEAFDEADNRYPGLGEVATKTMLSETELRLIKEIELTRHEIKQTELQLKKEIESVRLELTKEIEGVRLGLIKEIEGVRLEIKEVEAKLTKEIEGVRLELAKEIEGVRLQIKEVEAKLTKEVRELELRLTDKINTQTTKTVVILTGYITFIAALFKIFS